MKRDRRKVFMYRGVAVIPQVANSGTHKYFGCKHGEYLTRWWWIGAGSPPGVLAGTKADARSLIDFLNRPPKRNKRNSPLVG